jgi:hypothetical protein
MSQKEEVANSTKTQDKDGLSSNKLTLENLARKIHRCDILAIKNILKQKKFMVNQMYEGKTLISLAAQKGLN